MSFWAGSLKWPLRGPKTWKCREFLLLCYLSLILGYLGAVSLGERVPWGVPWVSEDALPMVPEVLIIFWSRVNEAQRAVRLSSLLICRERTSGARVISETTYVCKEVHYINSYHMAYVELALKGMRYASASVVNWRGGRFYMTPLPDNAMLMSPVIWLYACVR